MSISWVWLVTLTRQRGPDFQIQQSPAPQLHLAPPPHAELNPPSPTPVAESKQTAPIYRALCAESQQIAPMFLRPSPTKSLLPLPTSAPPHPPPQSPPQASPAARAPSHPSTSCRAVLGIGTQNRPELACKERNDAFKTIINGIAA